MTAIIDLAENAYTTIADFATRTSGQDVVSDVFKGVEKEDNEQIVNALLKVADKIIANSTDEKDIEAFFAVLTQTAGKISDQKVQDVIQVVRGSNDKPLLRTKLLNGIFMSISVSKPLFFPSFTDTIKYAQANNLHDYVIMNYAELIDELADEWNLSLSQKRDTYLLLEQSVRAKGNKQRASALLFKYLSTFSEADMELESATVTANATRAVVEALRDSKFFDFDDLNNHAAIRALSKSNPKLSALVSIFISGVLSDFQKFTADNQEFISSAGLSEEELLTKIRLLSLCTVLGEAGAEVPYDTVANQLQLDKKELERWVVKAVGAQLVNAKLDQVRRVVITNKTFIRQYTNQQWKNLGSKLAIWKESITSLLTKLEHEAK